jgi:apolipoprotein D and lipocalin family protein
MIPALKVSIMPGAGFLLAGFLLAGCLDEPYRRADDHTVERVDLNRYQGRWYVIATLPARFQRGCVCMTADYSLQKDWVAVVNACRDGSPRGRLRRATARADSVAGSRNSRLKVIFFWPFRGDYWIIALDPDYQWVMVGHPRRTYLWIMSRRPVMDAEEYRRLVDQARRQGYPVDRLIRVDQSCFQGS